MSRLLALLVATAAATAACVVPPGDRAQIRRLEQDRTRAIERGDMGRLYRLHDLDFRATCPFDRFRTLPQPPAGSGALGEIEIRGVRAWAPVAGSDRAERRAFVKDGGRWYLYEDTRACLLSSEFLVPGSWLPDRSRSEPGTRNQELVTALAVTDG